jgi:hypothetical protein
MTRRAGIWEPAHDIAMREGRAAGKTSLQIADDIEQRYGIRFAHKTITNRLGVLKSNGEDVADALHGQAYTRRTSAVRNIGAIGAAQLPDHDPSKLLPPEITGVAYPPRSCCHWPSWPTYGERPRVLTFCGAKVERIGAVYCEEHAAKASGQREAA